jgi:eukaryotic-like serine/threonine-protein kinase
MPEPEITQIGGRYQLTDVIGKGGMGIVYRGFDVAMSRQVAIKMLLGFDAADRETVLARFHREVTSLAALQHKNIVTIYTFEQFEGKPYMVMEYLEGRSLQEIISSKEPIELTEKLNLMTQICDGLQYAHENGIVHRDIKPANILVLRNGTAKLIDFGIARAGRNETITQPGQVIGSLSYMSPEQLSNHPLDARTDVFSAGVVLFQLLTGDLPFHGDDMSAIISQILHASSPPPSTYIRDLPKELDQIIERALAKKSDERYQSAEEFGFDISRVLETIKRGLAGEFIRRAKAYIDRQDWEGARQQLQEVRKIDRRNDVANDLFQIVTREIQRQQKFAQVVQLRSQAQLALLEERYEEALECIEQGLRIDEGDTETLALREVVKQRIKRAQDLDNALRRSQAAFYAGDLAEAQSAIEQALAFEPEHSEARTLEHLIKKEVAERNKRVQLQGFLDSARTEIGKKKFLEALQFIKDAQAIDPTDTSIQELLSWASRGHAQEKARQALEQTANEIGHLLRRDHYEEALSACDAALTKFPGEVSLLKLRELAQRQHEIQSRRVAVEEVGNRARSHAAAGEHAQALKLLEDALRTYPGDTRLETFLSITRAEIEHKEHEEAERAQFRKRNEVQTVAVDSQAQEEAEVFEFLEKLRRGLQEKSSIAGLQETSLRLANLADKRRFSSETSALYTALVSDYEARQKKFNQDLAELESLRSAVSGSNTLAETSRLTERSRAISGLYPREDRISALHQEILKLAHTSNQKREEAGTELSGLVRSMQESLDISQLQSVGKRVQDVSGNWPDDPFIRNLASQASARIGEVRARKRQILDELAQAEASLTSARSLGQLRLIEEQAKVLASDYIRDPDVTDLISRMSLVAHGKMRMVNSACVALEECASKISGAHTLEEAEEAGKAAELATSGGTKFEEVDDLLRKVQRLREDRKKDYARIERSLELLIQSAGNATGPAELDLILARRRDSLKKYPAEVCFLRLQEQLDASVRERRLQLAELAASEQQAESSAEGLEEGIDLGESDSGFESTGSRAQVTLKLQTATTASLQTSKSDAPRKWILLAGGVLTVGVVALLMMPKSVQIGVDPAAANIQVDGKVCETPCRVRLTPGRHELLATSPGFDEIHQFVPVPWFGGELPTLSMKRTLVSSPQPAAAMTNTAEQLGGASRIVVNTSQPGATVFVDGNAVGTTGKDGGFELMTKAGPHQVRVQKPGFMQNPPMNIRLDKDKVAALSFSLIQTPPPDVAKKIVGQSTSSSTTSAATNPSVANIPASPPPTPDSFIVLKAPAGAEVHVDQQSRGQSTGDLYRIKVDPGQRTIEVFLSGYQPWRQALTVDPGKDSSVIAALVPLPSPVPSTNPPDSKTPPRVSDEDRKQIQALLDRYADGYSQKNIKVIQTLWPSIPSDTVKIIKDFFKNSKSVDMKMHLSDATPAGNKITIDYTRTLRYTMDGKENVHSESKTLYMVKSNNDWLIDYIP